jgi:medium-chain acyl-[acyl-carrier-protein] hydrolase
MSQVAEAPVIGRWLPFGVPDGDVRMFCLPHAGGSASAYRAWSGRIDGVAVCPVQPPGRETRLRDTPCPDMTTLVGTLADVLLDGPLRDEPDRPYAVYGHSLGAIVGFELLREIRRRGGPDPVHLIVSGSPAPDHIDDNPPVAGMDQAQVIGLLRRLGGTPDWMLADPSVLRMILPPFQADFAVKESHTHRPEARLDVPVTAIAATGDPRVGPGLIAQWRDFTNGHFRMRTMTGGHFAVLERADVTHRFVRDALQRSMS